MHRIRLGILILLVISGPSAAMATVWQNMTGFVDLAAVRSEFDDQRQDTYRKEINGNFSKGLTPYVDMRLGLRYYRFDQNLDLSLGNYREEFQPSGELRWSHPLFQFSGSAMRRRVTTNLEAAIITNNLQLALQSRDTRYPLVKVSYGDQHTYYPDDTLGQDIRTRRLQAGADYNRRSNAFSYNLVQMRNQNVISGLESRSTQHLLRWNGQGNRAGKKRLSLTGSVISQYQDQTDEVASGGRILEKITAQAGLFARDDGPDLDTLTEAPGLIDGNVTDPTDPPIDIGGGNTNMNLGVDLGGARPVGGLYVYTDRPSGLLVRWTVYVSEDNLNWNVWNTAPEQSFNAALNRYEIIFPVSTTRYLKVVNAGLNDVVTVMVTELEVLRERPAVTREQRLTSVNILDGRAAYRLSDRWQTSLEGSFQHSEIMGATGDRTQRGIGWGLDYRRSRRFSHHLRLDYSDQWGNGDEVSQDNRSLAYTMVFQPLVTWRGALSISDRASRQAGQNGQDIRGVSLENSLALLPGLDLHLRNGFSRLDDHLGDMRLDSWTSLVGLEASPRDGLMITLGGSYLESTKGSEPGVRVRRTGNLGLEWRPGTKVYVRGNLQEVTETSVTVIREALMGWNLMPKVRLSGQVYALRSGNVTTTKRWSADLTMDVNSRSYLYLRLSEVDLSGGGGARTNSFQLGFRAGF